MPSQPDEPPPLRFTAQWHMLGGLRRRLLQQNLAAAVPLFAALLAAQAALGRYVPGLYGIAAAAALTAGLQSAAHAIGSVIIMPGQRRTLRLLQWLQAKAAAHRNRHPAVGTMEEWLRPLTRSLARMHAHLAPARQRMLAEYNGERVCIATPDGAGAVDGIVFGRPENGDGQGCEGALVYLGGNGEHFEFLDDLLQFRALLNVTVLLVNYRGVGESEGPCSRDGAVVDAACALAFLQHGCGIPAARTIVFGHSIGGGYGAEAARHFPGCFVVNDRSFSRLSSVAQSHLAGRLLADAAFAASLGGRALRVAVTRLITHVAVWELDSSSHFAALAAEGRPCAVVYSAHDAVIPLEHQLATWLVASPSGAASTRSSGGSSNSSGSSSGNCIGGRGNEYGSRVELWPASYQRGVDIDAHNRALRDDEKRRLASLMQLFLSGQALPPAI
jgi:pimeloyl-ACP methyl ester carboxylesterase